MTANDAHRLKTEEENLAHWDAQSTPLQELCLLQARAAAEHAATLIQAGELRETESIAALCPARGKGADTAAPGLQTKERLAFCDTLLSLTPDLIAKNEATYTPLPARSLQVATLENPLFLTAFESFAALLPRAKKDNHPTFAAVLDALANGEADLGVLPVEDAREGRLLRLAEQLEGREIELLLTTDVTAEDGNTVRFALLAPEAQAEGYRALFADRQDAVSFEKILECAVLEVGSDALLETLAVAKECGFFLRRTDARPAPYREDGFFAYPIFKAKEEKAMLFEAYLALFLPRTVIAARYYHIRRTL